MQPTIDRPFIAHPEYGVPADLEDVVDWEWVVDRFRTEPNFWICTSAPDGKPHARPVWGVCVDDVICFGGGPNTR